MASPFNSTRTVAQEDGPTHVRMTNCFQNISRPADRMTANAGFCCRRLLLVERTVIPSDASDDGVG